MNYSKGNRATAEMNKRKQGRISQTIAVLAIIGMAILMLLRSFKHPLLH